MPRMVEICRNCGKQAMERFYLESVEDRIKYDFIIENFDELTLESLELALKHSQNGGERNVHVATGAVAPGLGAAS